MNASWMDWLKAGLDAFADAGLSRVLRAIPADLAGALVLDLSSNDYLGLARDKRLTRAASTAMDHYGCGATASRLMSGTLCLHEDLEHALAQWLGYPAVLVAGSGFLTNMGLLSALADRHDVILADRLNHASLVDGARLSGATFLRYRHKDMNHLEHLLGAQKAGARLLIVSDSLFSMDGDVAPLTELRALADQYGALLIIDEAHALGVFGPEGAGVCAMVGIQPDIMTGTLSKALGGYGGFVACESLVRDYLVNRMRSFIYSTALPPACLGAAIEAVRIVRETPGLGPLLLEQSANFQAAFVDAGAPVQAHGSQIIPIMVGANQDALRLSEKLRAAGIHATAIRPPTVPEGTARIRLSVTLACNGARLADAASVIAHCWRELQT